jgi:hypothetical protein
MFGEHSTGHLQGSPIHGAGIEQQQFTYQRLSLSHENHNRFLGLQAPDNTGHRCQHPLHGPAVSEKRLSLTPNGTIRCQLKTAAIASWRGVASSKRNTPQGQADSIDLFWSGIFHLVFGALGIH